jgi:serine/threonine protein kinase
MIIDEIGHKFMSMIISHLIIDFVWNSMVNIKYDMDNYYYQNPHHCYIIIIFVWIWLVPSEYRMLTKKGEGTFSEVLKAQCIRTNKYVAIKCMKSNFENIEEVHQ